MFVFLRYFSQFLSHFDFISTLFAHFPQEVLNSGVRPASDEHSYAAKPAVNGETTSANKENSSSDSSSEGSSTESSSSSEGESEGEEKKTDKTGNSTPSAQTTPLRRGRGRPRKYADVYAAATPPSTSSGVTSIGRKRTSSGRTQKTPVRIIQNSPGEPNSNRKRGRGCGNCPGCLRDDCGTCAYCKDKPKFGGPGRKKQRCSLRVCSNFVSNNSLSFHWIGQVTAYIVASRCVLLVSLSAGHSPWCPQHQIPTSISTDPSCCSNCFTH